MSTKKSSGIDMEKIMTFSLIYFIIPLWFLFLGYSYMNTPEKQEKELLITKVEIKRDNPEPYEYSGIVDEHGREISFTSKNLMQNPLKPQKVVLSRSQLAFTGNMFLFLLNVLTSFGLPLLAFGMCTEVYENTLIPILTSVLEFIMAFIFFVFFLT